MENLETIWRGKSRSVKDRKVGAESFVYIYVRVSMERKRKHKQIRRLFRHRHLTHLFSCHAIEPLMEQTSVIKCTLNSFNHNESLLVISVCNFQTSDAIFRHLLSLCSQLAKVIKICIANLFVSFNIFLLRIWRLLYFHRLFFRSLNFVGIISENGKASKQKQIT